MNQTAVLVCEEGGRPYELEKGMELAGYRVFKIDSKKTEQLQELLDAVFKCVGEDGKVDAVVYAASGSKGYGQKELCDLTTQEWSEWKTASMKSFYHVLRAFRTRMAEDGKIIAVGSAAAITPVRGQALEGAASAALFMMVKSAAVEMAELGITVNALAVGNANGIDGDLYFPGGASRPQEDLTQVLRDMLAWNKRVVTGQIVQADGGFGCTYMREF